MTEILDALKARSVPLFKDGAFEAPDSGLARLGGDGLVKYADPASAVIETDDGKMRARFTISATAEDRAGDVVMPRGCLGTIDRYRKNPVIFLNHRSGEFPIAKSEDPDTGAFTLEVRDDRIVADAWFHGKTEESEKAYELVKLKYLRGASIGFNPIKGELIRRKKKDAGGDDVIDFKTWPGIRFDEWELLEWSVCGVPCQQDSLEGMKSWLGKNKKDTAFYTALAAMLPESTSVTVSVPAAPPVEEKKEIPAQIEPVKIAGVEIGKFTEAEIQAAVAHLNQKTATGRGASTAPVPGDDLDAKIIKLLQQELAKLVPAKSPVVAVGEPLVPTVETKMDDLCPPDASLDVSEEVLPEEPKKTPKLGAAVLQKLLRILDEAYHLIEAKLPQIENEKTVKFLGETHAALDAQMKAIHKFGAKAYPDTFPKDGKDADAPEEKAAELAPPIAPAVPEPAKPAVDLSPLVGSFKALAEIKAKNDDLFYRLTGRRA